jgi:cysteine sulfinate desulfinase/cysteine desulfurase-like protein
MKIPKSAALGSIRFSLGRYTTKDEIDDTLRMLPQIIGNLRKKGAAAGG